MCLEIAIVYMVECVCLEIAIVYTLECVYTIECVHVHGVDPDTALVCMSVYVCPLSGDSISDHVSVCVSTECRQLSSAHACYSCYDCPVETVLVSMSTTVVLTGQWRQR